MNSLDKKFQLTSSGHNVNTKKIRESVIPSPDLVGTEESHFINSENKNEMLRSAAADSA